MLDEIIKSCKEELLDNSKFAGNNSTNLEIEYAKKLKKEIIYYTDLIKNN